MDEAYRAEVQRFRREKDDFFRTNPESPLPERERSSFRGLAYYPPDARWRFEAALAREAPQTLRIPRTSGDEVEYTRVGTFRFASLEGEVRLAAYESGAHRHGELFVPFKDATSGKETYGAGRYLEAQPLGGGRYRLDFNHAYFPFCAYDEGYACPLPPAENWLRVPVRAGERLSR